MFLHLLLWAGLQLAATMSPGPAFAMTVRTAIGHHRRAGLFVALGLGLGVVFLMTLTGCGLAVLVARSPVLFAAVKYAGAAYLLFIGVKAMRARPHAAEGVVAPAAPLGDLAALRRGFLTNATNPKGLVFFLAVLPQFIGTGSGTGGTGGAAALLPLYVGISLVIEASWFGVVTLVLTQAEIRLRFMAIAHWIERMCGVFLCGLAARLAFVTAR